MDIHSLLHLIPKKLMSRIVGSMVGISWPRPLCTIAVRWFAKRYQLDLSQAEYALEDYTSIQSLFTRRLKPDARPIGEGVVSPVDGVCSQAGRIENGVLLEVKGSSYETEELLGDKEWAKKFQSGTYCILYLAPPDYHRIHSPINGSIAASIHVPGTLWPVNEWAVKNIPQLFVKNERLTTVLDTAIGAVAVIKVGATNVGSIGLSYDPTVTNSWASPRDERLRSYQDLEIQAGEELGVFRLGSTVVLFFEQEFSLEACSKLLNVKFEMGQQLFSL